MLGNTIFVAAFVVDYVTAASGTNQDLFRKIGDGVDETKFAANSEYKSVPEARYTMEIRGDYKNL